MAFIVVFFVSWCFAFLVNGAFVSYVFSAWLFFSPFSPSAIASCCPVSCARSAFASSVQRRICAWSGSSMSWIRTFRSLRSWTIWLIISLSKRSIRLSVLILKAPRERVEVRRAVLLSKRSNGTHSSRNWLTACRVSGEAVSGSVRSSW